LTVTRALVTPAFPSDKVFAAGFGENKRGFAHDNVRWGGELLKRTVRQNKTCFQILSCPLDRHAAYSRRRPVVVGAAAAHRIHSRS
jgi:starvation-inducible outer membrane lipoprotein